MATSAQTEIRDGKGRFGGQKQAKTGGGLYSHFPRNRASTGPPGPKKKARASLAQFEWWCGVDNRKAG